MTITARALLTLVAGLAAVTLPAAAQAGTWMQVSCVNPNGSAAPSDGWTGFSQGSTGFGSNNDVNCAPGSPMTAILGDVDPAPVGASEDLEYQPPGGSTLAGGSVQVSLRADGGGTNASGTAVMYEPAFRYDGSDVFFQCAFGLSPCANDTNDYAGALALPAGRGGDLFVSAGCGGKAGFECDSHPSNGAWSEAQVSQADLLLSSTAAPQATAFSGSALQKNARGTAHVVFTATDPGGPGVYSVTASIDGRPVWSGTPNTNGGGCVAVGTDSATGALMFDASQPCLPTEVVDIPVPTAGLPDGGHELSLTVTDAAQNSSTVLDQTITTSNPQTTPVPKSRRSVHARFVISWSWNGPHTTLRSITVHKLTKHATVSVACLGHGCPRLKVRSARAGHVNKLLHALDGKRLHAGDKLHLTVTAPHRRAERIQLQIRTGRLPRATLLKR